MNYYWLSNIAYPDDGLTPIPEDAVEIPIDHWFMSLKEIPEGKEVDTGPDGLPVLIDLQISVYELAIFKLKTINNMADAMLQPITSTYPNIEIISWDKQEIEARRWQEWQDGDQTEPEPPTSYIDNILLTRKDVDKPELIRRIIYKADTFSQSGQVTGIRQTLEKQIESILADDTLTDDQKREAINAIDARAAFSVVTL
ncbi:hypothetical protein GCM10023116_12930 [Kistimonas scapharcae]|uniref:Uncharacterized protein n=1 Tax=Kistimonas scapharcae TaxID=1036133 RepID=A0ABP8V0N7_9GAMM